MALPLIPPRMTLTDYHAKYFAHELTKRCASERCKALPTETNEVR